MSGFHVSYQFDAKDCGPASLKMIADYYKNNISYEHIKKITYVTRGGVSLLSINNSAEQLGFKTNGGKITLEQLREEALLPCIIHWNQNHFVVLYKIKNKSFFRKTNVYYVADPALGKVTYTEDAFVDNWISTTQDNKERGVILLLEPGARFYQKTESKDEKQGFRFLFNYFLRYKKFFFQLFLGLFLGGLIQLVFPFITKAIVDRGIANKDISFIYLMLLAQVILIASRASVDFIRRWILLHISTRVNISLISDFFIKLMKLPMSFFETKLIGDILQRIEDHERVERLITTRSLEAIFSLFTLFLFLIVLYSYSVKIFLIFFIGSVIYTIWIFFFLKKRRELDFKRFDAMARENNCTYQMLQGIQDIKLQNYETQKRWDWEDTKADLFKINIKTLQLEQIQEAGNIVINELRNVLITIVAALAVIKGEMTLGMMLATQYIIGQLNGPIETMADLVHDIQDSKISLERIREIHMQSDENQNKLSVAKCEFTNNTIAISNLSFSYDGTNTPNVLDQINLIIPENKTTAIVGLSGSGKTTLIKLLLQYYDNYQGNIKVGGKELKQFNTKWWRRKCGVVMQDSYIFTESIADNITTSSSEVDKQRMIEAAKVANIHDFIMQLPLKYNTMIGNDGQNLSQGQRQRILIARSVYNNPSFLFFDEATNALDANNEKIIVSNLNKIFVGKTVVVVAHRLSTVKNADQIVVLDKGRIVEIGNHKELSVKKGPYYMLVKDQLELGG